MSLEAVLAQVECEFTTTSTLGASPLLLEEQGEGREEQRSRLPGSLLPGGLGAGATFCPIGCLLLCDWSRRGSFGGHHLRDIV